MNTISTTRVNHTVSFYLCVLFLFVFFPIYSSAQEQSEFTLSLYDNPIAKTKTLIEGAKQQVKAVLYKFEDKKLLAAIKDAHDRGVKVQLLVDMKESESKKSKVKAAADYGVKVRKWPQGKLHAKFAIIDTSQVIAGSFNWTKAAKKKNVEIISYYSDQKTAKRFIDLFDDLWNKASSER